MNVPDNTGETETCHSERMRQTSNRMRERIYIAFTALAVLMAISQAQPDDAGHVLAVLTVTVVGVLLAGFTADVIAHLIAHEALPDREELAHMAWVTARALGAVVAPAVLLVLAMTGIIPLAQAMSWSIVVLLIALAVIIWTAVHGAHLARWRGILVTASVVALGVLVVVLEVLAHHA
jgi:hypothetical protein